MKGSVLTKLKKALTVVAKEDIKNGEKIIPKGTKLRYGTNCPKCGQFYPFCAAVRRCNACGFVNVSV